MKHRRLFQGGFVLLAALLVFAAMPNVGGAPPGSDRGTAIASLDQDGGPAPARAFVPTIATYEQGPQMTAYADHPVGYVVQSVYTLPGSVKRGSGFAAARYGKARARAPDLGTSRLRAKRLLICHEKLKLVRLRT